MNSFHVKPVYVIVILIVSFSYVAYPCTTFIFRQDNRIIFTNMKIYFRIFETPVILGEQKIFLKQPGEAVLKVVDFTAFDFNCQYTPKVLDLNSNQEGVVNQYFTDYSTGINKKFISDTFTFFKGWGVNIGLSDEAIDYLAKYPESFQCHDNKL